MNLLDSILQFNRSFVEHGSYEAYLADKIPKKEYVVISCMDSRFVELLPACMNFRNGDAILIQTGGAIVSRAFGSVMRSILISVYQLGAKEIFVIGHHDCGLGNVDSNAMIMEMKRRGITENTFNTIKSSGIDLKKWLEPFNSVEDIIKHGIKIIRNHPLLDNIPVHGLMVDPNSGKLDLIESGYEVALQI